MSVPNSAQTSSNGTIRRLTGQKLEEISLLIPEPPPQPTIDRNPYRSANPRPYDDINLDNTDSESESESVNDGSNARLSEESYRNPYWNDAEPVDQIEQLNSQLQNVREQLVEAKTQLALEQSKRPTLYDDQYFKEELDQLRYEIRQWCSQYFSHTGAYFTRAANKNFRKFTHNWAAYLDGKEWRPWLIQARVWDMLQLYVFDEDSKKRLYFLFAGPGKDYSIDKLFSQASRNGSRTSRRAYREWRASTFTLLFPGRNRDTEPPSYMEYVLEDHILKLRHKLWRSLRPYSTRDASRAEKREAKSKLLELIENAVYLDLDIKKHTVDISFTPDRPIFGAEFDPRRMEEAIAHKGKGLVELVVSPPLYKETDLPNGKFERRLLRRPQVSSTYIQGPQRTGVDKVVTKVYTRDREGVRRDSHASFTIMNPTDTWPRHDSTERLLHTSHSRRKPG